MFFTRQQHNNIDFLRALAVTSVFIHHAQHVFGGDFPFFGNYGGQFGPQLFFLISGYLIFSSYAKYSLLEYTIHRAFRIFPAYLFYFIGFGILSGVINFQHITSEPLHFLTNIILLQQFYPSALIGFDSLHVTWTLTVELIWYITVPLIFYAFKKISTKFLLASIGISTFFVTIASTGSLDFVYYEVQSNSQLRYLFIENSFPAQFCFFVFGAFIYSNQNTLKVKISVLASIIFFLVIYLLQPYYLLINPLFITGISLFFLMTACTSSPPLQSKIVFFISEISFSIYLCHFPILKWVQLGLHLQGVIGVVTSIVLTVALSTLTYLCIERPGIDLGRKLAKLRGKSLPILPILPTPPKTKVP